MRKQLTESGRILVCLAMCGVLCGPGVTFGAGKIPDVGKKAPDFTLKDVDGEETRLSELTAKGSVMLVVLRGYPRAQSPACKKQFADMMGLAAQLKKARTFVVFVYPGDAEELEEHAREFLGENELPRHFYFLLDPDYEFGTRYGLRWDATLETCYPTTFLIDQKGLVRYKRVSRTHGGRPWPDVVMREVGKLKS